jgi:hypothetical protein
VRQNFVKGLVPDSACLFHAIDTFHQSHYPVLFSRLFETGRLFYEDSSGFREDAMEEGGFDIHMLDVPVKYGSDVE